MKGTVFQPRVLQLNLYYINWLPHSKYPNRKNYGMCRGETQTHDFLTCRIKLLSKYYQRLFWRPISMFIFEKVLWETEVFVLEVFPEAIFLVLYVNKYGQRFVDCTKFTPSQIISPGKLPFLERLPILARPFHFWKGEIQHVCRIQQPYYIFLLEDFISRL